MQDPITCASAGAAEVARRRGDGLGAGADQHGAAARHAGGECLRIGGLLAGGNDIDGMGGLHQRAGKRVALTLVVSRQRDPQGGTRPRPAAGGGYAKITP